MKIYVARHGVTKSNKLGKLNGKRTDEPLEPEGVVQAEETEQELAKDFTVLYASPMIRTRQTAEIMNKNMGLPISYYDELKEVDFGLLTQKTWEEIDEEYGEDVHKSYLSQRYDFSSYQGEKVDEVKERVLKIIDQIKTNHPEEKVLIVAHGGILRALYHIYYGQEIEGAGNASVHEFEV